MFDIGFWEMCLITVVGLLVVGPERLPDVARKVGRWVGQAQRMIANVKSDINREMESGELRELIGEQKKQIQELQSVVNETRAEVETSTRESMTLAEKSWAEQAAAREETLKHTEAVVEQSKTKSESAARDDSADSDKQNSA
ncbi:MAG: Sec-independent protein translocase protein TatB [Pseudomonadota bacterium]